MWQREHDERVERLVARVLARTEDQGFASLEKASVSHFVPDPHDPRHRDEKLDVRELNHVLEIDSRRRVAIAEPGVTFADLLTMTLPLGLAPKLVPELETITLGGAVSGCAVESMAFRHGGFHDSCREYELVTGTGEVITCSPTREPELFGMVHGSYGTLGIITKLVFELIEVGPFVHLEYLRFASFADFHRELVRWCRSSTVDFVDGIGHREGELVLCLGRFVHEAPYVSSYRREHIYYRSTVERSEDYLTTRDYYFRFDTDCHWATNVIPGMRSKLLRRLLGGQLLGSANLLRWAERFRPIERYRERPPVVTDLFVPNAGVLSFYEWYEREIGHYPLWIVPYQMSEPYPWIAPEHAARMGDGLFIDFAIYGMPNQRSGHCYSEQLEQKTLEIGGIKTLIGQNHYDESTFFQIYDRDRYERAKQRTDPSNLFRRVFEKRCAAA